MDRIIIQDLAVQYHVGVPDEERAHPQRLLLTIEMEHDFDGLNDSLGRTIDYYAVSRRLLEFGRGRSWRLIETLASDIVSMILTEFKPARVSVEVKKFTIPEAQQVAVKLTRPKRAGE